MTEKQQIKAAKEFAARWEGKGDEKQETALFWIDLLQNVLGVENPTSIIQFEKPVVIEKNTKFIDGFIPSTKVLIEQKSIEKKLGKTAVQSDGEKLTPYGQAFRYNNYLPYEERARWIIVSNFERILIYNMNKPNGEPDEILLKDLPKQFYQLQFLTEQKSEILKKEEQISIDAGNLVGKLYDALIKQYKNPDSDETKRSLNMLCVRLVFCLYAEDSQIFDKHEMFGTYLKQFPVKEVHKKLRELFKIMDMTQEQRDEYDPYMDEELAAFPYVNGGLFADEKIEIPPFTDEIVDILVNKASAGFDWSEISPTIFGAVFESTLNQETRRSGGMHYTSVQNILKVIDPLFLDELRKELDKAKEVKAKKARTQALEDFRDKLASLTFLDPACGSGNFLTQTYIELRKLENEALKEIIATEQISGQMMLGGDVTPIKVGIHQLYGIEINDFAVSVARTALWIAEHKMLRETENIMQVDLDFLPLKSYTNIIEGNALRVDWESVVPKDKLSYIMGNPPFVGYSLQSKEQKNDMLSIYVDEKGKPYKTAGKIDYVSAWYFKASQLMEGTAIRTAFVSTNSITQGEQVAGVWKPLYDRFSIHIDFAHRTFRWDSEANLKAHVHCVIVGFSIAENNSEKRLFDNGSDKIVNNINPFLVEAPNTFIENRSTPICDVPKMTTGNRPADGGRLIIEKEEYADFIKREPNAVKYIKKLVGSTEFINNKERYCLWLVGISPAELRKMPEVMKRVDLCRQDRLNSPDKGRQKLAETPTLFRETNNPESYIIVPAVSSERRKYVPMGFMDSDTISTNLNIIIPNATIYHFGILTSNVHMAWMRTVCGRLKNDYRYSKDIVYNNFPWCSPTAEQKAKIEKTAQAILDARALYPDSSLADLYDELTMPPELRKAHQANDKAVMEAYGFWGKLNTESECVAELMKMYQRLTEGK
ncbi:MAG: methylase [Ruminococcus sp.]|nr:methylase [Ruminococcus sp.]